MDCWHTSETQLLSPGHTGALKCSVESEGSEGKNSSGEGLGSGSEALHGDIVFAHGHFGVELGDGLGHASGNDLGGVGLRVGDGGLIAAQDVVSAVLVTLRGCRARELSISLLPSGLSFTSSLLSSGFSAVLTPVVLHVGL